MTGTSIVAPGLQPLSLKPLLFRLSLNCEPFCIVKCFSNQPSPSQHNIQDKTRSRTDAADLKICVCKHTDTCARAHTHTHTHTHTVHGLLCACQPVSVRVNLSEKGLCRHHLHFNGSCMLCDGSKKGPFFFLCARWSHSVPWLS